MLNKFKHFHKPRYIKYKGKRIKIEHSTNPMEFYQCKLCDYKIRKPRTNQMRFHLEKYHGVSDFKGKQSIASRAYDLIAMLSYFEKKNESVLHWVCPYCREEHFFGNRKDNEIHMIESHLDDVCKKNPYRIKENEGNEDKKMED